MKPGDEAYSKKQVDEELMPSMNVYVQSVAGLLDVQKQVFANSKFAADDAYASGEPAGHIRRCGRSA